MIIDHPVANGRYPDLASLLAHAYEAVSIGPGLRLPWNPDGFHGPVRGWFEGLELPDRLKCMGATFLGADQGASVLFEAAVDALHDPVRLKADISASLPLDRRELPWDTVTERDGPLMHLRELGRALGAHGKFQKFANWSGI